MSTATSDNYTRVPLYGGALSAALPDTFKDVSEIRQVPDNQEVYLDAEGFTSVVFDILERVDAGHDEEAMNVHLGEVLEDEQHGRVLEGCSRVELPGLPQGTPAYAALATAPPGEKQRGRPNEPAFVAILLLLVRLVEQKTDLLITVNVPVMPGQDAQTGLEGREVKRGRELRDAMIRTLEVRDWGLFVQD